MTNEQLVARIKARDNEAENMLQLWQQCRRFINGIAKHYQGCADIEDLEHEGYLALYDAVNGFDIYRGYKFLTYAESWIRRAMVRYIQNSGTVRIPVHEQEKLWEYKKLVDLYHVNLGRNPSRHEIAFNMRITVKEVDGIEKMACMEQIGSIDIYTGEDGDNAISDLIPDDVDVESSVLDAIEKKELKEVLWPMVDTLPGKQPQVIRSLFQEGKTLKATGEEIGVTTERVRTIQQTALRELSKPSRSKILAAYLPEAVIGMAYRHNGTQEFNSTWTSSTELAALKIYEEVCTSLVTS